jgi:PHP family Zn ribbon phosphoesterase
MLLPKIQTTKRAKQELKYFEKEIEKISDGVARQQGLKLLTKLKSHMNIIHQEHTSTINKSIYTKRVRENVDLLVNLRKKILKLIKDANS